MLAKRISSKQQDDYSVPINLTDHKLSDVETSHLKYGLHHSFDDKNKHLKVKLATEFESLVYCVRNSAEQEDTRNFHHFLRTSANSFTKNIYNTPDNTWKSLWTLAQNPDISVLRGDKDWTVVIIPRAIYISKLEAVI